LLPWLGVATVAVVVRSGTSLDLRRRSAAAKFLHELLHFTVDFVTAADSGAGAGRTILAPAGALLSVGTITSHVTGVATDAADDAGGVVLSLGAIILAVANLTTVLAGLVLVVSKGTVERGKLTQLIALKLVLSLGNGRGRFNDVVDQLLGLVDLVLGVGHDETVQILFLVAGVGGVGAALAFLDGTFTSDGNLGTRLLFHCLECVTTGADEQANFEGESYVLVHLDCGMAR
jgi:hypothetical protein